jgi:hypothetical protein
MILTLALFMSIGKPQLLPERKPVELRYVVKVQTAPKKKWKWYWREDGRAVKCTGKMAPRVVPDRGIVMTVDGCPFPEPIVILKE